MSDPTLDLFNKLAGNLPEPEEDPTAFPGKVEPKNRSDSLDRLGFEWLNDLPCKEFLVGNEKRQFYTIGALAQALNRTPVTIRSWESKGWLPAASHRTQTPSKGGLPDKKVKGRRLYSKEQLVFLAEAFSQFIDSPAKQDWDGFRDCIKRQYPK